MATASHEQFKDQVEVFFGNSELEEIRECPLCGGSEKTVLFSKETLEISRCKCGFTYNSIQPTQATLNEFYSKSRAMTTWTNLKTDPLQDQRQKEKFSRAVEYIKAREIKEVLDIGCGTARFLSLFDEEIKTFGIDENESALEIARNYGVQTKNQGVDAFLAEDTNTYDCITLWGVLEHYKRPLSLLERLREKVNKGKYLLVCVPNVDSWVFKRLAGECYSFCPQHLWYFNYSSLTTLASKAGFMCKDSWTVEPEGLPIAKKEYFLNPYGPLPAIEFHKNEVLARSRELDEMILQRDKGYKIVAVFERI